MKLIKKIIKDILHGQGYTVVKIGPPPKREVYQAYYQGECFKCIKGDPLTEDILKGKIWDAQIPEILNSLSREGAVVEVGANIGTSILPHSQKYPDLKFKLYEPVPAFFGLLKENHKTFNKKQNVEIFNFAFGEKDDDVIEINVGLGTAGKTKLVHYQMADETLRIPSHKIDSVFNDEKISLIKIDVDGHELSVLKGAHQVLSHQHPQLFLEFAPRVMDDIAQSPLAITDYLKNLGYNKIKIWDHDAHFIKTSSDWDEVIRLGRETPHYLNILVSKDS